MSLREESFPKDVREKKWSLLRIASDVGSMAGELQNVREVAMAQEAALNRESASREAAEAEVRKMAREMDEMQKSLDELTSTAQRSTSVAEQSLKELLEVTERLAEAEETSEDATATANSLQLQCENLSREVELRSSELQQERARSQDLRLQLAHLEDDFERKDSSEKRLRSEVAEHHIKDQELQRKVLKLRRLLLEAKNEIRSLKKIAERRAQENQNLMLRLRMHNDSSTAGPRDKAWSNLKFPGLLSVSVVALFYIAKR